ncbi:hypothetical protein GCM10007231_18020 [Nocardioides daphniae]|uniref:Uncharacterized protein n=1 Tax=Nocardioides daphniae TaxID=402297 RepID=A0ABQ1Q965_9ACTN|nr:hypothetical protein GCM10007231_18020 [Nocardioides daphniae]
MQDRGGRAHQDLGPPLTVLMAPIVVVTADSAEPPRLLPKGRQSTAGRSAPGPAGASGARVAA